MSSVVIMNEKNIWIDDLKKINMKKKKWARRNTRKKGLIWTKSARVGKIIRKISKNCSNFW